jgi:hypothetical protein
MECPLATTLLTSVEEISQAKLTKLIHASHGMVSGRGVLSDCVDALLKTTTSEREQNVSDSFHFENSLKLSSPTSSVSLSAG